jgi:hypothetical protein
MRPIRKISVQILMSTIILSTLVRCNPSGTIEKNGDPIPTEMALFPSSPPSQLSMSTAETAGREDLNSETQEAIKTDGACEVQPTRKPT